MESERPGKVHAPDSPEAVGNRAWVTALILIVMVLIGSSTATAAKFAVSELPIPLLPVFRFGVAGLLLLPWSGGIKTVREMMRLDVLPLLGAAFLAVPVNQGFFLNASRLAPTTHVGLIYALCPLVVLGLAFAFRQENLDSARLVGILASVSGAAVIAAGSLLQRAPGAAGAATLTGDLLLIGAVTSWGAYLTVNKRLLVRYPSIAVLSVTFLLGAAMSLPHALWTSPGWIPRLAVITPRAWGSLIYLTVVASIFGLACQNMALKRLDASHVAAVGNLSPVLTVLWGVWLLGEGLTSTLLAGGFLCLAGVLLASHGAVMNRNSKPASTGASA